MSIVYKKCCSCSLATYTYTYTYTYVHVHVHSSCTSTCTYTVILVHVLVLLYWLGKKHVNKIKCAVPKERRCKPWTVQAFGHHHVRTCTCSFCVTRLYKPYILFDHVALSWQPHQYVQPAVVATIN